METELLGKRKGIKLKPYVQTANYLLTAFSYMLK